MSSQFHLIYAQEPRTCSVYVLTFEKTCYMIFATLGVIKTGQFIQQQFLLLIEIEYTCLDSSLVQLALSSSISNKSFVSILFVELITKVFSK